MRIVTSKPLPSTAELTEILKREFADHYSYKLFGLGKKSIIVGKSPLVGAQISIRANEISIQATLPSLLAGILATLVSTELVVLLIPLFLWKGLSLSSQIKAFNKEIGLFLKHKYN